MIEKLSFGTHDGSFHADEVTACALLLVFNLIDRAKIVRTRDEKVLVCCEYVCDVGGVYDPQSKRFDHHQVEYTGEMSSAGMVLKYLLESRAIDDPCYQYFNRSLILGIDAHDNGKVVQQTGTCTISHVIANYVPSSYEASKEELNAAFFEAVSFVEGHLRRFLERFHYIRACREEVALVMKTHKKFLLFDRAMPWVDVFFDLGGEHHPALFVIMPSGEHWKLRGIPPTNEERMSVRVPLPQEWAGLLNEELQLVSGIPGAVFCHKGRFISVWRTKEDALKALHKII